MKAQNASAGKATVKTTFDRIFPTDSEKIPFFLQTNPNNIIKTVEVIALTIDISVKVDRKMSNKFIFLLLIMFIYSQ
ncbi:hypothetical protein CUS38_04425 [Enterococcus faecium]|nr:hypothetical protein CKY08_02295 [Enterococcus faecium]PQF31363.1 hypothetical protein CUT02_12055 [Enterococcus faecium]PQF60699.1 hypothetical protein CUS78_10915 [Enterococcus faecium]PQF75675.1 hypothetical protein CUS72_09900 [Enterococcus faecium]PQF95289.1 hypothetical protein CUS60_12780 [Enterococcus faecium]